MKTNAGSLVNVGSLVNLLRLEGGVEFACALAAFHLLHGSWMLLALLFLLPDLSMLGYLLNSRAGAWIYNAAHSYVTPAVLAGGFWLAAGSRPSALWLAWFAHIAFDRMLGFGLKYPDAFRHTHLGVLGRVASG